MPDEAAPPGRESRRAPAVAATIVALATSLAYANSLRAGFVFDDAPSIVDNPLVQNPRPIGAVLAPAAGGLAGSGRPLVTLSYALNAALAGGSGSAVGFHLANGVIHVLAALTLFGVGRRTLDLLGWRGTALPAAAVALVWALHPLQTEAVTYLSQRSESLAGLLLLLALYGFVRGWLAVSVAACAAGMATKEVMAVAPLLVWLYDRTFVAGSFAAAWRARRGFYLSLAGTWLVLAGLVIAGQGRGGTAGWAAGISPGDYLLTQCVAIPHYLRLALWPAPLVIDYGRAVGGSAAAMGWGGLLLLGLLAATVIGVVRSAAAGVLGAWFFLGLAPSSSVLPIATETIAEHRMYLPLAAVSALLVLGTYRLGPARRRGAAVWSLGWIAAGVGLAAATIDRNRAYENNLTLFADAVRKLPDNPVAQNNLAAALAQRGEAREAIAHFERAIELRPRYAEAQNGLGGALNDAGRAAEAIPHLETALRLRPGFAQAENNLGTALVYCGRVGEAVPVYEAALRQQPKFPEAENNLAFALNGLGRASEAIGHAQTAIQLRPGYAEAHNNLGNAFALTGDRARAIQEYREALRLRPDLASARMNLHAVLSE